MNTSILINHIHNKTLGLEILDKANQIDQLANGVQLWGSEQVTKVALGVSCNGEFLNRAYRWGAKVCIFHHGLGTNYIFNSRLSPHLQKQLAIALNHQLTIAGYHYVLDAHPKLGNNAQIIQLLGAKLTKETYFQQWGFVGEFDQPKFVQDIAKDCSRLFKHDVHIVESGPKKIKRFGVCSGGGKPSVKDLLEISEKAIQLHITGEIGESGPAIARETGFNYFACGHYATEVFGIKALAQEIKKAFPKLEVQFIEVWNEL